MNGDVRRQRQLEKDGLQQSGSSGKQAGKRATLERISC